jgi:predicted transcriptional regulator
MAKQTTVRLPDDLADEVEAVARAQEVSINQLIIDALRNEIDRVREDSEFRSRVKRLVERDRRILDRLAE